MENKVKIGGEEYKLKNTLRTIFIFEEITGKAFTVETVRDNYIFLYSALLANNPEKVISWDSFIDALDSDPGIYKQMSDILSEARKTEELLAGTEEGKEDKKKE